MNDQIIIIFGFMALIGIISVIALSGVISTDVGCHIIGKEVNGDYSTEYLSIGNCY
jgi:hypothetical protein